MLILFHLLLILRLVHCRDNQQIERKTVGVGDRVKLTCPWEYGGGLYWIRLVPGKLPEFLGKAFSSNRVNPRITIMEESGASALHIEKATISDTGNYYCMKFRSTFTFPKGINLRVEGVQPITATTLSPAPVSPGDVVTSQCSLVPGFGNHTFPGEDNVCCCRATSNPSSQLVFTPGDKAEATASTKEPLCCLFQNISTSDYSFCTVATCADIVGNSGSKPHIDGSAKLWGWQDNVPPSMILAALALSLTANALCVYYVRKLKTKTCNNCKAAVNLQRIASAVRINQQAEEDSLVYSTADFTHRKSGKKARKQEETEEEECYYTEVRALGLR